MNIEMGKLNQNSVDKSLEEHKGTLNSQGNVSEKAKTEADQSAPDDFVDKPVEVKQSFLKRMRDKCCRRDQNKPKPVGFEINPNLRIKNTIKRIVNGRFVLTLMTFVTIFALIGVSNFQLFFLMYFRRFQI